MHVAGHATVLTFLAQELLPTRPWDQLLALGVLASIAAVPLLVRIGIARERRRLEQEAAREAAAAYDARARACDADGRPAAPTERQGDAR